MSVPPPHRGLRPAHWSAHWSTAHPLQRRRSWGRRHRPQGLRGRLTRLFALTAVLAVILTTALTVGASFRALRAVTPAGVSPAAWEATIREAGQGIIGSALRAAFLSAGLAVVIAGLATRQLTRPLARLAEGAGRLAEGQRDVQLPVPRRQDELRDLTLAFNDLTISLARQEAWRRGLIADIAHDLRTPLSVLRSEIEAIQDGVQPVDGAALGRLHGEVLLLARLVSDLRLLSLAEGGALSLNLTGVDAGELLSTLADAQARRAAEAGVSLSVQAAQGVWVRADPDRLRQTLQNLLDNALRYAAPGEVELGVSRSGKQVTVSVRDHGPGFTPDALSRAFERFYRADASRSRDPQGRASSGLGLAIARALTEAQGGTLSARNHPGGGAEFTVSLPAAEKTAG